MAYAVLACYSITENLCTILITLYNISVAMCQFMIAVIAQLSDPRRPPNAVADLSGDPSGNRHLAEKSTHTFSLTDLVIFASERIS
jgi:hypothetical protein